MPRDKLTVEEQEINRKHDTARNAIVASLLSTGNYSDCKITSGTREWKVHRFVLCSQSTFFKGALEGNFKEAKEGTVDLSSESPAIIDALLQLMYGAEHDLKEMGPVDVACLYEIAFRLDVPGVAEFVRVKLPSLLWDEWCFGKLMNALAQVVSTAYNDMPGQNNHLRGILVDCASSFMDETDTEKHSVMMKAAFGSSAQFAYGVALKLALRVVELEE